MEQFKKLAELLMKLVRVGSFPVAVKLFKEDPQSFPLETKFPSSFFGYAISFCQGIGLVRRYGWKVAFRFKDNACPLYVVFFGLRETPAMFIEGEMCYPYFTDTLELGRLAETALRKLPTGIVKTTLMAPLDDNLAFIPDMILVYGNAAQICKLIAAANYRKGSGIEGGPFTSRGACSSSIVTPFLTKECRVSIPGGGERVTGHAADDELVFSIPLEKVEDTIFGLEATDRYAIARYPTHFKGMQIEPTFPNKYNKLAEIFGMTAKGRRE
jgi:uncharacterized protein (DUF169 family)